MHERKRNAKKLLFAGFTICFVIFLSLAGCSNPASSSGSAGKTKSGALPENPVITKTQVGLDFTDDVDISSQSAVNTALLDPDNKIRAVISLSWSGAGATSYNLYWSDENIKPDVPNITGVKTNSYAIRGLDLSTQYYIWVEGVNTNGTMIGNVQTKTTRDLDLERGDYPRNIKIEPANGQLTVWWDMPDRVGWHEVYYAPVGTINHADAYNGLRFKWNEAPFASGTAYKDNNYPAAGQTGYTGILYPFESPLVAGTYRGYYIGLNSGTDPDTRPIMGINDMGKTEEDTGYNETFASYPPSGAFPYIFEGWKEGTGANDLGKLQPYTVLDSRFDAAGIAPWSGTGPGIQGKAVRHYNNSVTITGLTNGTQYEVWIRCPNVNGERGYGYIVGTPGSSGLAVPANIRVTTPSNTTRDLEIKWDAVQDATSYRLYFSKFNEVPGPTTDYTRIAVTVDPTYIVTRNGLLPNTTYYVFVVAEKNGVAGEKGSAVTGKTGSAPASGIAGKLKAVPGTSQVVRSLMYVEVNDNNPLNAGSYILEDGTYLFDYVVLFAANIRIRNCALETDKPHACTKNGVHVHFNENVRHILYNRSKYIKPLQDKGIKVLLGILPDHDGKSLGNMDDDERAVFVADLKNEIEAYNLDGVDLDDEWAAKEDWENWSAGYTVASPNSIWVYPISKISWPFDGYVYRIPEMGIEAGNGTRTANSSEDQARMWRELGVGTYKALAAIRAALPGKIISLYEYNTGRYVTPDAGTPNFNSLEPTITSALLGGLINFSLNPMYNQYLTDSANGLPRTQYGSLAADVSGYAYASQNGAPNPPMATTGTNSITDFATRFRTAADDGNPYGYIDFYGLNPSTQLLKSVSSAATATVPKEEYLSIITEIIFGQKTILTSEGGDYRKDW